MDLFNNSVGRYMGSKYTPSEKASKAAKVNGMGIFVQYKELADIIQEHVRNGGMLIIVDGKLVNSNSDGEK